MTSIIPFEPGLGDAVAALWRTVHPDWTWLDVPEMRAKMFEPNEYFERVGYVVQRGSAVIASVFSTWPRESSWSRNRQIDVEARSEDITADWLDPLLTGFAEADREHPDTWHVANPPERLWPALLPLLEAAGFTRHTSLMLMEWTGDKVPVLDPSPVRLECYVGGNPEFDKAIVELHNRSYRWSRLTPPARIDRLWETRPGVMAHEYVLALDADRVVGYAEWLVFEGKPFISSLVAARSHWGTPVGAAAAAKAMEILVKLGHRRIESYVFSTNAPSMKLQLKYGWRPVAEQSRSYVRRL